MATASWIGFLEDRCEQKRPRFMVKTRSRAWNDPRHESRRPRLTTRNKGLEMEKGNVIRQSWACAAGIRVGRPFTGSEIGCSKQ